MKQKKIVGSLILAFTALLAASGTPLRAAEKMLPRELGPKHITLGHNLAVIDLPKGYGFVDENIAKELMKRGGSSDKGVLGLLISADGFKGKDADDPKANNWFIVCRWEDIGHVRDDDAGKLNPDEILNAYKEGTKEQNDDRKNEGIPPIYVGDWAEKPRYEKKEHQVVWAIQVKDQDSKDAPVESINYNTRILGRRGVLSLNLVTDPDKLQQNKGSVSTLLSDTSFVKGEKYEDFKQGVDKDAGIGLAGLILGGGALAAAAKFGVLGGMWKFILAGIIAAKKLIIVGIAAIAAFFGKVFGKKKPPSGSA